MRFEDITLLALKTEEEAMSQAKNIAPEAGKGEETYFPLEPSEGTLLTDWVWLNEMNFKHLASRAVRE